jgi:hypothetical protein
MKKVAILLYLSLLITNTFAQSTQQETLVLKGRVIDLKTRKDLPGATIQLMRADSTVIDQQTPTTTG